MKGPNEGSKLDEEIGFKEQLIFWWTSILFLKIIDDDKPFIETNTNFSIPIS